MISFSFVIPCSEKNTLFHSATGMVFVHLSIFVFVVWSTRVQLFTVCRRVQMIGGLNNFFHNTRNLRVWATHLAEAVVFLRCLFETGRLYMCLFGGHRSFPVILSTPHPHCQRPDFHHQESHTLHGFARKSLHPESSAQRGSGR